ncbi:hypothetical protein [Empedobacter sp. UBA7620]|uniref:hypothetical protein n=1 Tax=Empedobacter sp. UBA7620 TaxID=1946452 RepID=UPI0025BE4689|nr:hypothetical protein [Empedobacter sp. UBA7620]
MKHFSIFLILFLLPYQIILAQKQNITAVKFDKENIFLNNQIAFNYQKNGNNFYIYNLKNVEIIKGEIQPLGNGKFTNKVTFILQEKQFKSSKIVGRNQLIFALTENNVIKKDFSIDEEKLTVFLNKLNEVE